MLYSANLRFGVINLKNICSMTVCLLLLSVFVDFLSDRIKMGVCSHLYKQILIFLVTTIHSKSPVRSDILIIDEY